MSGFQFDRPQRPGAQSGGGASPSGAVIPPTGPVFPPPGPTSLQRVIPSYLYKQFEDDDDLQTFVAAQNYLAQQWVNDFNALNLPVWSGLSGALLDWVAQGLYGIRRPVLSYQQPGPSGAGVGPYATMPYDTMPYDGGKLHPGNTAPVTYLAATDDVFQRILTWHLYKGDGFQFSTRWLKRRVHRFLNGRNGYLWPEDETYDVSITCSGTNITITVPNDEIGTVFQYAVQDGVLALPFQYAFTVALSSSLVPQSNIAIGRFDGAGGFIARPVQRIIVTARFDGVGGFIATAASSHIAAWQGAALLAGAAGFFADGAVSHSGVTQWVGSGAFAGAGGFTARALARMAATAVLAGQAGFSARIASKLLANGVFAGVAGIAADGQISHGSPPIPQVVGSVINSTGSSPTTVTLANAVPAGQGTLLVCVTCAASINAIGGPGLNFSNPITDSVGQTWLVHPRWPPTQRPIIWMSQNTKAMPAGSTITVNNIAQAGSLTQLVVFYIPSINTAVFGSKTQQGAFGANASSASIGAGDIADHIGDLIFTFLDLNFDAPTSISTDGSRQMAGSYGVYEIAPSTAAQPACAINWTPAIAGSFTGSWTSISLVVSATQVGGPYQWGGAARIDGLAGFIADSVVHRATGATQWLGSGTFAGTGALRGTPSQLHTPVAWTGSARLAGTGGIIGNALQQVAGSGGGTIPMQSHSLYYLTNVDPAKVQAGQAALPGNGFDVVIVEATTDGVGGDQSKFWTASQVASMRKNANTKVFGYLDIQAETQRCYYSPSTASGTGWTGPTLTASGIVGGTPNNWGEYGIQIWAPAYYQIVQLWIQRLVAAGFDGIYFDVCDTWTDTQYVQPNAPAAGGYAAKSANAAAYLEAQFFADMRAYGRTLNPNFLVAENAGEGIVSTTASNATKFINAVDFFYREEVLYQSYDAPYSGTVGIVTDTSGDYANFQPIIAAGKPVGLVEYVGAGTNANAIGGGTVTDPVLGRVTVAAGSTNAIHWVRQVCAAWNCGFYISVADFKVSAGPTLSVVDTDGILIT